MGFALSRTQRTTRSVLKSRLDLARRIAKYAFDGSPFGWYVTTHAVRPTRAGTSRASVRLVIALQA